MWIVDVDGKRLVIEAATEDADMPASPSKEAEQEIGDMMRSIHFA